MATLASRIHPLVAFAALSVTLLSGVGIAAITGYVPVSHGTGVDSQQPPVDAGSPAVQRSATETPLQTHTQSTTSGQHATHATSKTVETATSNTHTAPAGTHQPVAQNSPVGIGVGALIGGVIGNQFGSGDSKILSTVAGAIGGSHIGNEVAKKNPA